MQYYDKYWRFPYSPEIQLNHGGVYHPFTGYLDFYILIILGGEFDKLGPLMGTPFYEKAKQVSDQAAFDAQFSTGWKERSEFIDRLMGEENKLFRQMKDRYYLGLSYVEDDDDTRTMVKLILEGAGCTVYTSSNGGMGIRMLKQRWYDLLILDMISLRGMGFLIIS